MRAYTDLGMTCLSPHGTPREHADHARREGERYGYPKCCVDAFVEDVLHERLPALRRGSVPLGERGARYVPCPACAQMIGREIVA